MEETAETTRSNRRITARKACLLTVRYKANPLLWVAVLISGG